MPKQNMMLTQFVRTLLTATPTPAQQQKLMTLLPHTLAVTHIKNAAQLQRISKASLSSLSSSTTSSTASVVAVDAVDSPNTRHQNNHYRNKQYLQSNSLTNACALHPAHNNFIRSCGSAAAATCYIQSAAYSKFTAARDVPVLMGSQPICEERAHELVSNLKDSERAAIKLALDKYDAMRMKENFEGKLAATQWRTRFGRLTKVPAGLGDTDPTGTFCPFPDDWLKKKAAERAKEPTSDDLWKIFFVNAVPFVAFGFLDNFTMIIAGDYIEHIFGTFMCISTMAAAGLGNTISDILGIGSAYYVERGCEIMGLRPPDLSPAQMEMKSSRKAANYGRLLGITVGCLVGMFPLLFMDNKKSLANEEPEPEIKTASAEAVVELADVAVKKSA